MAVHRGGAPDTTRCGRRGRWRGRRRRRGGGRRCGRRRADCIGGNAANLSQRVTRDLTHDLAVEVLPLALGEAARSGVEKVGTLPAIGELRGRWQRRAPPLIAVARRAWLALEYPVAAVGALPGRALAMALSRTREVTQVLLFVRGALLPAITCQSSSLSG